MNENRRNWITWVFVAATLVIIAVMLLGTLQRPERIQLPVTDLVPEQSADNPDSSAITVVAVTPDTVQAAIASLERPEAYQRKITLEQIWNGGSGTSEVDVTVREGWTRTDRTMPGGQTRHTITDGETTYIWYNGEESVFAAAAGEISADMEQGIPTYEDILDLPKDAIVIADYRVISGVNCIYVETAPDEGGYALRYWVDVNTGLLVAAEKMFGEEAVYRMASLEVDRSMPAETFFLLPDGTALLEPEV